MRRLWGWLWKRKVAAGWYVGAGLAFLFVGVPPHWLDSGPVRTTFIVVGALCLVGAAYEWWWRKDPAPAPLLTAAQSTPVAQPAVTLPTPSERRQGLYERVMAPQLDRARAETVFHERRKAEAEAEAAEERLRQVRNASHAPTDPYQLFREAKLTWPVPVNQEPDVMLEFESPGPFRLRNYGATACQILVEMDLDSDWFTITFPLVTDLHSEPRDVTPDINPHELGRLFGSRDQPLIMTALHLAARREATLIEQAEYGPHGNSLRRDEILKSLAPLRILMTVKYTDRHGTTNWHRVETLVYEPSTQRAHIEHGGRLEFKRP
jgi:hypothetical protein